MKTIIKQRENGSTSIAYDFSDEKCITDQHYAKELTMASIVKKLEKGIMPNLRDGLVYSTDLGVRNLQDVVQRQKEVSDLFYQLPTEVRQLMGNDLQNFEKVITDPNNAPLLKKHGLIQVQKDEHVELINAINSLKDDLSSSPEAQK